MGRGYILKCDKCEYEITANLGIGMSFPRLIKQTIQGMKSGAYGEKARKFFQENPDGTVDCAYVLFQCESCGNLQTEMDLSLYKRKEGAADDPRCLFPDPETHVKAEVFDHKCERCGNSMQAVDESDGFFKKIEKGKIRCPKCSGHLHVDGVIMWD